MPIRHGLLALLAEEPGHGFRLRAQFERRTGGTWPLNVGQVYTTLTRLVRDGLVEEANREAGGSVRYALTEAGRAEVEERR
jgi:DNA-binding PadR family transcriptional regulator